MVDPMGVDQAFNENEARIKQYDTLLRNVRQYLVRLSQYEQQAGNQTEVNKINMLMEDIHRSLL